MSQKQPYRRRNFLIIKNFQLRFCLYSCSWIFALSLVFPYIIYSLFDFFLRYVMLDPMGPEVASLTELKSQMLWLLVGAEGFFLLLTFAISIFISHRIAGPLYKMTQFFAKAKAGTLEEELRFRKADHFQEMAETFNDFIRDIQAKADTAREALAKKDLAAAESAINSLPRFPTR